MISMHLLLEFKLTPRLIDFFLTQQYPKKQTCCFQKGKIRLYENSLYKILQLYISKKIVSTEYDQIVCIMEIGK